MKTTPYRIVWRLTALCLALSLTGGAVHAASKKQPTKPVAVSKVSKVTLSQDRCEQVKITLGTSVRLYPAARLCVAVTGLTPITFVALKNRPWETKDRSKKLW